ncbi:MAG: hypothetical protein JXR68_03835 [Bacteroidales bacterium]|nr:hypothetical protein [Bacteroidales bacterium]
MKPILLQVYIVFVLLIISISACKKCQECQVYSASGILTLTIESCEEDNEAAILQNFPSADSIVCY